MFWTHVSTMVKCLLCYSSPGHCFPINADLSDIVTYWTAPLGYPKLWIALTFWHWRYLLYFCWNWITYLGQYQGNCFQKMERVGALYDRLASPRQNPWNLWFIVRLAGRQECDILVSKFLGFETCQFFEGFCNGLGQLELGKKKIWSRFLLSENLVS